MIFNHVLIKLLGTIVPSVGLVVILFLFSEDQLHRNNAFTRRYPPHPIIKQYDLDIGYNSYYIAGFDNDLLYLGNSTAPWHLLQINVKNRDTLHIELKPSDTELKYRSLSVSILPPYFFIMDGTVPFILRGKLGDWKAKTWIEAGAYFNAAIPIDSNALYVRTTSSMTKKYALGILRQAKKMTLELDTTLLETQIDGRFDVDGVMLTDLPSGRLAYVYYYRNEFMAMDPVFGNAKRYRTIDTIKVAQIQLTAPDRHGNIQMAKPPLLVNKTASIHHGMVLIQSDRLGKNESRHMLDQASIIDVYNVVKGTYEFSFYLYHVKKKRVREFAIQGNFLIALVDDHVSIYRTQTPHFPQNIENNGTQYTTGP
ncbi:hypothetical protein F8C76_02020 [Flagellimonas olearia]|uniref:Uncharacterized protein n=1 Tax=Flagellimonas olearia TaxID=552546 RepID=A0A6I1DZN0_9FLAO|nr:hypothetical protein [Allomuricauda olearia]KAB7530307.1 hypothetical protein F8C76_02020 [Allomuricauda olearia]